MNAAIVSLILSIGPQGPHREVKAEILAAQIVHAAKRSHLEPELLAALVARESNFDQTRRGKLGELGLGQLKRGTLATTGHDHLSDAALENPVVNLSLTAAHMRRVQRKCGDAPPAAWLSLYSGRRLCRPSAYSRKVIKLYQALKKGTAD